MDLERESFVPTWLADPSRYSPLCRVDMPGDYAIEALIHAAADAQYPADRLARDTGCYSPGGIAVLYAAPWLAALLSVYEANGRHRPLQPFLARVLVYEKAHPDVLALSYAGGKYAALLATCNAVGLTVDAAPVCAPYEGSNTSDA